MATTPKRNSAKGDRRGPIIAAIHAMKRELAMEDDSYRSLLARVAGGKRSCSGMNYRELGYVADEMKRLGAGRKRRAGPKRAGTRPMAPGDQASKIRALWLSLYNLAEIDDPSEAALARFGERTTGIEALEWLGPADADKLIKALRGWCRRKGFHEPMARRVREIDAARESAGLARGGHGFAAKVVLIELQWQRALDQGAFPFSPNHDPKKPISIFGVTDPALIQLDEADRVIELFGHALRRFKAEGGDG